MINSYPSKARLNLFQENTFCMLMSKGGLMIMSVLSIINVVINVEVNVVRSFLKQISFFDGKDSNWG